MAQRFLERNKKKGLLAALLLFLRRRPVLSILLLVVMLASTIIVTPSYMLIDLPGGARLVAGVAWIAQKTGVDTSRWGLGGKASFKELMTAFRHAKEAGSSRSVGWGSFFGRAAEGTAPSSLDMVKGSRKDLESMVAKGAGKPNTIAGILTPEESKASRGMDGVAISEGDLGGERKGFFSGLKNMFGSNGDLSGGAFVSKGFFSGGTSAGGKVGEREQAALDSVGKVAVPQTRNARGASGRLSTLHTRPTQARSLMGGWSAMSLGNRLALTQLAEGKGRATMADQCTPPGCPSEYGAVQAGAIYDGTNPSAMSTIAGAGDTAVPNEDAGAGGDAAKIQECAQKVQQCQQDKKEPLHRLGELQDQVGHLSGQLGGACGDPCSCGGCNSIKNQIRAICNGEMKTVLQTIDAPCDLPAFCADHGISDPSTSAAGAAKDMCAMDMGSCGCDDWCCDFSCLTGS